MSLTELYDGRAVGVDTSGDRPTRSFYGADMTVDEVRADSELPDIGSPHNDYPDGNTVAHSVNVSRAPGGAVAVVTYGNKAFVLHEPGVDDVAADFQSLGLTYETVDVSIPVIELRKVSTGEGDDFQEKIIWALVPNAIPYRQTRTVLRYQATLEWTIPATVETIIALGDIVKAQSGKLHRFGGPTSKQYMFRPESIQQETSRWRVVYQWISDEGIRNTFDFNAMAGPGWLLKDGRGYPIEGDQETGFTVPPFTRVDISPNDDPTITPTLSYTPIAHSEDIGWNNLPGLA